MGNSRLRIQWCKVALPSEDIADPSAEFKCTAAGSILVLYWSLIMLYTLVQNGKQADPESITILNLLSASTVSVGQFDTSPMV